MSEIASTDPAPSDEPERGGMPLYLDEREPEIEDPSKALENHHWQPACDNTFVLTRCLEALRDTRSALATFSTAADPLNDRRQMKPLVLPIHNFAVALGELCTMVLKDDNRRLSPSEKQNLTII